MKKFLLNKVALPFYSVVLQDGTKSPSVCYLAGSIQGVTESLIPHCKRDGINLLISDQVFSGTLKKISQLRKKSFPDELIFGRQEFRSPNPRAIDSDFPQKF